jgi:hypothetical protein
VVDTPSGQIATESADGYCDLLEAIEAANSDRAVRECPAGSGADRIVLAAGATYPVPRTLRIDTGITLGVADGSGGSATVTAAPGFETRGDDRWSACLIHASGPAADVKLADIVLTQDPALALSGACATSGRLELRRGRVTGFTRGGIAGHCRPELGCDHETMGGSTTIDVLGSLIDGNRSPGPGAGVYSDGPGATLNVRHSAIVNNVSELSGGGLYFGGGWDTQRIANSTVSGNRAASGGGVYAAFASCTATYLFITNSTVAYNTATRAGGGIDFDAQIDCYAQDVTVLSSIVTNNVAGTAAESDIDADWKGGMFACDLGSLVHVPSGSPAPTQVGDAPCRFDDADAVLGPLTPMGGTGNLPVHPLRRGSPAIDAATADAAEEQQRDAWIANVDPRPPVSWTLFDRVVDGDGDGVAARDLGAFEVNEVWQAELLQVHATGPAPHAVVTTPDGYDRGAGTSYGATGASGHFVTYVVPVAEAGSYEISVGVRRAEDGGQLQAAVAGDPAGPWTEIGTVQDTYAAPSRFEELPLASMDLTSAGQKLVRFTVPGKRAESAGYRLYLDYLRVKRRP